MYYEFGDFVPWREPAWALLAQRTALLADRARAAAALACRWLSGESSEMVRNVSVKADQKGHADHRAWEGNRTH
jgi:hypothetical protein